MSEELYSLFKSVMKESDTPLLSMMQKSLDFTMEMVNVLAEVFFKETGRKRIPLTQDQRLRLHTKGCQLSRKALNDISKVFQADTILGWFRREAGKKYDRHGGKHSGPAPVPEEVEKLVISMARRNPTWGYDKIVGYVTYLGHKVSKASVKRILDANGLVPIPDKRTHTDWAEFIAAHKDVIAATDFMTVEVMERDRLERYHVQFYIKVGSRKVELGGIRCAPTARWVNQAARNVVDSEDGFLLGQEYLIHDRDPLSTGQRALSIKPDGVLALTSHDITH